MLQRGQALSTNYNEDNINTQQLKRNEFSKPDYDEIKLTETNSTKLNQTNSTTETTTIQLVETDEDNEALREYMVGLCNSFINVLNFRLQYHKNTNLTNALTKFQQLHQMLSQSIELGLTTKLNGGVKRNISFSYKLDDSTKTVIKLNWSINDNDYVVLEYIQTKVITVNEESNSIYRFQYYTLGDNHFSNLTQLLTRLSEFMINGYKYDTLTDEAASTVNFNYQVLSMVRYYINRDIRLLTSSRALASLCLIHYTLADDTNNNLITNYTPMTYMDSEFDGDCHLNTMLSVTDSSLKHIIITDIINKPNVKQKILNKKFQELKRKIINGLDWFYINSSKIFNSNKINTMKTEITDWINKFPLSKYQELSEVYVSIKLIKVKIKHLSSMIIDCKCKLNFRIIAQSCRSPCYSQNDLGDLIVTKHNYNNKYYIFTEVILYQIPHSVLLVIERNDVNESNSNDKAYIIDLNDMKILSVNDIEPYSNEYSDKGYSVHYIILNVNEEFKAYYPDKECGVYLYPVWLTNESAAIGENYLNEYYRKFIEDTSYISHFNETNFDIYRLDLPSLFNCNTEDIVDVSNSTVEDILSKSPSVINELIQSKKHKLNNLNILPICLTAIISYLLDSDIILPWYNIIPQLDEFYSHKLRYMLGLIQAYDYYYNRTTEEFDENELYVSYSEYHRSQLEQILNILQQLSDIVSNDMSFIDDDYISKLITDARYYQKQSFKLKKDNNYFTTKNGNMFSYDYQLILNDIQLLQRYDTNTEELLESIQSKLNSITQELELFNELSCSNLTKVSSLEPVSKKLTNEDLNISYSDFDNSKFKLNSYDVSVLINFTNYLSSSLAIPSMETLKVVDKTDTTREYDFYQVYGSNSTEDYGSNFTKDYGSNSNRIYDSNSTEDYGSNFTKDYGSNSTETRFKEFNSNSIRFNLILNVLCLFILILLIVIVVIVVVKHKNI